MAIHIMLMMHSVREIAHKLKIHIKFSLKTRLKFVHAMRIIIGMENSVRR